MTLVLLKFLVRQELLILTQLRDARQNIRLRYLIAGILTLQLLDSVRKRFVLALDLLPVEVDHIKLLDTVRLGHGIDVREYRRRRFLEFRFREFQGKGDRRILRRVLVDKLDTDRHFVEILWNRVDRQGRHRRRLIDRLALHRLGFTRAVPADRRVLDFFGGIAVRILEAEAYQMQEVIDGCGCGYSTQGAIKNLFGQLDRFALELDIITKCNSTLISAAPIPPSNKVPFTDDEVDAVWKIAGQEWADSVLFFLYTGFRISEMLTIKIDDVDLDQLTIKGGIKTKAGKNRIVPIHPRIEGFVRARVKQGNKFLFSYNGKKMSSTQYYTIWNDLMEQLKMHHTPHECRHTFRSRLDSANANKRCIDLLMGHTSKDVGERVYTHKTLDELRNTINLLR